MLMPSLLNMLRCADGLMVVGWAVRSGHLHLHSCELMSVLGWNACLWFDKWSHCDWQHC
jgi:hypothetical protein